MAYGDNWERELDERIHRWQEARWAREWRELDMVPNDRLDEVGWDIFYCAIARGMDEDAAARRAMDGNRVDFADTPASIAVRPRRRRR